MAVPSSTPRGASEQSRLLKKIWKSMSPADRTLAVRAASRDRQSTAAQSIRQALVRSLRMRPVTVQSWGPQQLADASVKVNLDDELIADLLVSFHLSERVPLLTAFLDAAGVPHTAGATDPEAATSDIDPARIETAAELVSREFPEEQWRTYFATLIALEGGAWEALRPRLGEAFD
jgi:hypothetical protein